MLIELRFFGSYPPLSLAALLLLLFWGCFYSFPAFNPLRSLLFTNSCVEDLPFHFLSFFKAWKLTCGFALAITVLINHLSCIISFKRCYNIVNILLTHPRKLGKQRKLKSPVIPQPLNNRCLPYTIYMCMVHK